jgi:hypothetical protein
MTTRKNKSKTPKNTDKRHKATVRAKNHPRMIYESTHVTYTSHPAKGEPYGVRTSVSLKNGEGVKKIETLNQRGKTIKSKQAPIHNSHFNKVKNGKYVPGLWDI